MHVRVNGASKLVAALLMLATLSAYADSEESSTRPEPTWAPSLAVTSGVTFQQQKASLEATIDSDTPAAGSAGDPLTKSGSGQDWVVSPYVGVNAELMTPEIPGIPGGIRLFVNGEYLPTFGADVDIAKEGDPVGFVIPGETVLITDLCLTDPFTTPGCNCPYGFGCFAEEAITGVGARTTATIEQDVFGAAIGVAVPLELFGRKLMLKPSFGWIRYEVEVEGLVLRAFKIPVPAPTSPNLRDVPVVRTVELRGSSTQAFNAIGPGLELEMEVHQAGPIQASLFFDAHGYRVLGDRKVKFSSSGSESCPSPALAVTPDDFASQGIVDFICIAQFGGAPTDYSADWSFKVNPWLYRMGVGLRFRWTGE